jgi:hypothetical protein
LPVNNPLVWNGVTPRLAETFKGEVIFIFSTIAVNDGAISNGDFFPPLALGDWIANPPSDGSPKEGNPEKEAIEDIELADDELLDDIELIEL